MKIELEKPSEHTTKVGEVYVGDVFLMEPVVAMRVTTDPDLPAMYVSAVDLSNGNAISIRNDVPVVLLDARLSVVRRKPTEFTGVEGGA